MFMLYQMEMPNNIKFRAFDGQKPKEKAVSKRFQLFLHRFFLFSRVNLRCELFEMAGIANECLFRAIPRTRYGKHHSSSLYFFRSHSDTDSTKTFSFSFDRREAFPAIRNPANKFSLAFYNIP